MKIHWIVGVVLLTVCSMVEGQVTYGSHGSYGSPQVPYPPTEQCSCTCLPIAPVSAPAVAPAGLMESLQAPASPLPEVLPPISLCLSQYCG